MLGTRNQEFVNQRKEDPRLRQELANVYFRLGGITQVIYDYPAALQAIQEVQQICQSLLKQIQVGPMPVKIL